MDEINHRLKTRERMISQIKEISAEAAFKHTIENSKKPTGFKCIVVHTDQPLQSFIEEVLRYIEE
jgi:hypothetical protein